MRCALVGSHLWPKSSVPAALCVILTCACNSFPWRYDGARAPARSSEVETLNEGYDRNTSRALVRQVRRPTRANLDYAAYVENVLLNQPRDERVGQLAGAKVPQDPFAGLVERSSLRATLAQTPLSAEERAAPLAFTPLVDYLTRWNADKAKGLERARSAVRAEAWGLKQLPGLHFQQITVAYVHRPRGARPQLWVKIEFQPWAALFDQMPDDNADGHSALYGKIAGRLVDEQALRQIARDYAGRPLRADEIRTWGNELASYWYPSYNTDIVELGQSTSWPLPSTESAVTGQLGGLVVERPAVVIRGKPQGEAIYNVFVVPDLAPPVTADSAGVPAALISQLEQGPVTARPDAVRQQLGAELAAHGGSWKRWVGQQRAAHAALRRQLKRRAKKLQALVGKDGFLFYRKSLDYIVGGDVQAQPKGKNPLPTIVEFKEYLAGMNTDFLLVPVPTKAEVFPDKLPGVSAKAAALPLINPHGRKFLLELTQAGVEVIDLLPAFLRARSGHGQDPLYQLQDTHWTDRGLRLAAEIIAERIKRYDWYGKLTDHRVAYSLQRVAFTHLGDLHSRLADSEQSRFGPQQLVGHRVADPSGKLFEDEPTSPIVVLGDSFTGVFQRTDPEHAGVSAHLAHQIGFPVDLVMSYGGGPNVRKKLLSRGEDDLRKKRLLIWILTARDFHDYWEDWEPLQAIMPAGN